MMKPWWSGSSRSSASVDRDHAGHGPGVVGVDALDPGVGDRRAHERDVEQSGDGEVVVVLRGTGEDAGILPAQHRVAEDRSGRRHCFLPPRAH